MNFAARNVSTNIGVEISISNLLHNETCFKRNLVYELISDKVGNMRVIKWGRKMRIRSYMKLYDTIGYDVS